MLYGIVATIRNANFGRLYAGYCRVLTMMVLVGWQVYKFILGGVDIKGIVISIK